MNFVFDLYGTLVDIWTDEERRELWEGLAELLGEDKSAFDGVKFEYVSLCHKAKTHQYHEIDLLSVFREMLSSRGLDTHKAQHIADEFRRISMVRIKAFHGVKSMLKELRSLGGVYLLSNAQSCFTMNEIESLGLKGLFDGIIISSDVGVKKPSTGVFEIAFNKFGITPDNSVYVGNDLRDDVLGASGAGMTTVYIPTEQSGRYDNMPEPDYRVKNHRELKRLLLSMADMG